MRRFLTVLAAGALLAAPAVTIAKNPFDFGDWVRDSRRETETSTTEAPDASDPPPAFERPAGGIAQTRPGTKIRNYADELFADPPPVARQTAERSPNPSARPNPWGTSSLRQRRATVPLGRPRLTDRPTPTARITRDALRSRPPKGGTRRFGDFVKSRNVVNAKLEETEGAPSSTEIQPVVDSPRAASRDEDSLWGPKPSPSPASHSLKRNTTRDLTDGSRSVPADRSAASADPKPASNRFSFVKDTPAETKPVGNRLTDAIPTTPGSGFAERRSVSSKSTGPEQNPFSVSDRNSSHDPNDVSDRQEVSEAASLTPDGKSRFSISRAAPARAVRTPMPVAAPPALAVAGHVPKVAAISAAWRLKGLLNVGQECPCELLITNPRESAAKNVSVEARLPGSLHVVETTPAATEQDGMLRWQLNDLAAGEQRTIQVVLVATEPGPADIVTNARSTDSHVQSLTVTEPQLSIVVNGPTDVAVGEPATQTVTVRNPGSGIATNIKLEALIPDGLEHVRGNRLLMDIGSLNPGETRRIRLALAAVAGGEQVLNVEARADSGLIQQASASVTVAAPQLKASIEGPKLRYLGRKAMYTLRIENDGAAATDAVQMVHRIPEGFDFLSSDRGARFDESSRMLTWFVGRLSSEQPEELHVTLLAKKAGEFRHAVRATSEHGSYSDAQLTTRVEGTASLVVEVADLDDPVEVGTETAYEVTITNEGTASSHAVTLACELPGGLTLLNAEGPSGHRVKANTIQFQPVAEVGAGETITYRVYVQGTDDGDKRFRCRVSSEHLSQPLFTEEVTKFYGE